MSNMIKAAREAIMKVDGNHERPWSGYTISGKKLLDACARAALGAAIPYLPIEARILITKELEKPCSL